MHQALAYKLPEAQPHERRQHHHDGASPFPRPGHRTEEHRTGRERQDVRGDAGAEPGHHDGRLPGPRRAVGGTAGERPRLEPERRPPAGRQHDGEHDEQAGHHRGRGV
ncbi:hypothetical protein ACFQ0M_41310 [Kitasatospora aburaviensis]